MKGIRALSSPDEEGVGLPPNSLSLVLPLPCSTSPSRTLPFPSFFHSQRSHIPTPNQSQLDNFGLVPLSQPNPPLRGCCNGEKRTQVWIRRPPRSLPTLNILPFRAGCVDGVQYGSHGLFKAEIQYSGRKKGQKWEMTAKKVTVLAQISRMFLPVSLIQNQPPDTAEVNALGYLFLCEWDGCMDEWREGNRNEKGGKKEGRLKGKERKKKIKEEKREGGNEEGRMRWMDAWMDGGKAIGRRRKEINREDKRGRKERRKEGD
ncbi:hypothetical protein L345_07666, partial [Ophiophagus hannah]